MIDRDKLTEEILAEERVRLPIHPGRVLELEWLEPLGMSVNQLAKAIGVRRARGSMRWCVLSAPSALTRP
jgi:hypothetical protein